MLLRARAASRLQMPDGSVQVAQQLVGPLVIVDSLPFLGALFGAKTADEARPMADAMREGMSSMSQAQYEEGVRGGRATRGMVTADADHARVVAWGLASDRAVVANAMAELVRTDLRQPIARIATPVLVIGTWVGWSEGPGPSLTRGDVEETFRAQYAALPALHFAMAKEILRPLRRFLTGFVLDELFEIGVFVLAHRRGRQPLEHRA